MTPEPANPPLRKLLARPLEWPYKLKRRRLFRGFEKELLWLPCHRLLMSRQLAQLLWSARPWLDFGQQLPYLLWFQWLVPQGRHWCDLFRVVGLWLVRRRPRRFRP